MKVIKPSISVNCKWGPWSEFGPCSQACEGGKKSRTREVAEPAKEGGTCEGDTEMTEDCNPEKCMSNAGMYVCVVPTPPIYQVTDLEVVFKKTRKWRNYHALCHHLMVLLQKKLLRSLRLPVLRVKLDILSKDS